MMLIQEGLDNKQLPEAGFGINIIENLDSSFASTLIATFASGLQPMISNGLKVLSCRTFSVVIVLAVIFIPILFFTYKKNA